MNHLTNELDKLALEKAHQKSVQEKEKELLNSLSMQVSDKKQEVNKKMQEIRDLETDGGNDKKAIDGIQRECERLAQNNAELTQGVEDVIKAIK